MFCSVCICITVTSLSSCNLVLPWHSFRSSTWVSNSLLILCKILLLLDKGSCHCHHSLVPKSGPLFGNNFLVASLWALCSFYSSIPFGFIQSFCCQMLSGLKYGVAEFTVCRSTRYNKGILYTDSNFKTLPKSNVYENILRHKWASSKDFSGAK
jgi:hypothetical protein